MWNIIPKPKTYRESDARFSLDGMPIVVSLSCDRRIFRAAHELRRLIERYTHTFVTVKRSDAPDVPCVRIDCAGTAEGPESYRIDADGSGVRITGDGLRGTFWGIQTLRQMILLSDGVALNAFSIADCPDYADRGFYHDVTRGRVPTLDTLKELCDTLALFKIGSLQLYVEDAYDFEELNGIVDEKDKLSAEEVMALDDYCYERFIELVPSTSNFGHLYQLLQSERFRSLCEYEDYRPTAHPWMEKMAHHTIDPTDERAFPLIRSMLDQYAGLCRSRKFNICCDETFDLGKGKNAGKDTSALYFDFVKKIISYLQTQGKTVMMWADIVSNDPSRLSSLPEGVILLNWFYRAEGIPTEKMALLRDAGCIQYVCPGTSTWNHFTADAGVAEQNITGMAAEGKRHGAVGFLNTNWGDLGNIASLTTALWGLVIGAERGWNADERELDAPFRRAFSRLCFDERTTDVAALLREMSRCESDTPWRELFRWYSDKRYRRMTRDFPCDIAATKERLRSCEETERTVAALAAGAQTDRQKARYDDLLCATEGITFLHRLALYAAGAGKAPDPRAWLERYTDAWLRCDKPSQIDELRRVVMEMCE